LVRRRPGTVVGAILGSTGDRSTATGRLLLNSCRYLGDQRVRSPCRRRGDGP
jgi:hypothetical protein